MQRICTTLFLLFLCFASKAQKPITIDVEQLKRPEQLLRVNSYQTILEDLIRADNGVSRFPMNNAHIEPGFNIVAKSVMPDSLVSFGYHPFFEGMYNAYASHRPFALSPDMMWLLIAQGFSQHINNNSEELRSLLVDFKGKASLIVRNDKILLNDPNSPWHEVFPEFSKQISQYTGKELTDAMTADFSTTTSVAKIASQVTLMDALESYFEFIVIRISCGIPQITLEGTPEDWQRVLNKTNALRKYKLDWWIDEMQPILKQVIAASKGKKDTVFWQGMFKVHSPKLCGKPELIDGWIVKFFPYNKFGKKNDLKLLSNKSSLPDEIVKVDLNYLSGDLSGKFVSTPLELWAGFVGLKQNDKTFGLRPELGWMIRKKDIFKNALAEELKKEGEEYGIMIRVKEVPEELMHIGPINRLSIDFIDEIKIPDKMADVKIKSFNMSGSVSDSEIQRICKLMPNTMLTINKKRYNVQ